MSLIEILLSIIALFVFLNWYEHSDDLLRVMLKYRKIRQNTMAYIREVLAKIKKFLED